MMAVFRRNSHLEFAHSSSREGKRPKVRSQIARHFQNIEFESNSYHSPILLVDVK